MTTFQQAGMPILSLPQILSAKDIYRSIRIEKNSTCHMFSYTFKEAGKNCFLAISR
jgi:hypothetical protein